MILGIDGGGSKTRFALVRDEGGLVAEQQRGTCHYQQVGFDGFGRLLEEGMAAVLQEAGGGSEPLRFVTLGVPGLGESPQDSRALLRILEKIIPCPYAALNDVKLAWAGALACEPGICIVAGTGAMSYGLDFSGKEIRCGGWGCWFGDEGSAYWLGLKTCEIFSKMADGRLPQGPLYHLVKETLGLSDDFALISKVAQNMGDRRRELAGLARLLDQAAVAGDGAAQGAFVQAAGELALLVGGSLETFQKTSEQSRVPVSFLGGVFQANAGFLTALKTALARYPVFLVEAAFSSVQGACLYAAIEQGRPKKALDLFKNKLLWAEQ